MVNKGPIKANRNMSHFTAVQIVNFIWLTYSPPQRNTTLPIPLRNCCLIQVRAPFLKSVAEIFYFFIDHIHLGLTNRKRVIEKHHYQSHRRVVEVSLAASTLWENTKNTRRKRKSPIFRWVCAPSMPEPLPLVYFSASLRPHLSHFWAVFLLWKSRKSATPLW